MENGRSYEICTIHYAKDIISLHGFRSKWFLNFNQITLTTWFEESYHRICHVTPDPLWCNIEPLNRMLTSVRYNIYPPIMAGTGLMVLRAFFKANSKINNGFMWWNNDIIAWKCMNFHSWRQKYVKISSVIPNQTKYAISGTSKFWNFRFFALVDIFHFRSAGDYSVSLFIERNYRLLEN